jgi:hypothetical protein
MTTVALIAAHTRSNYLPTSTTTFPNAFHTIHHKSPATHHAFTTKNHQISPIFRKTPPKKPPKKN